jgi:hypothetical protein
MARSLSNLAAAVYCLMVVACINPPPPAVPPPPRVAAAPTAPPTPAIGRGAHEQFVSASVAGLYSPASRATDEDSLAGGGDRRFGLYTYVLLGSGTHDQNKALLLAMLPRTASSAVARTQNPISLNLIAVPIRQVASLNADRRVLETASGQDNAVWSTAVDAILRDYDYGFADTARIAICTRLRGVTPADRATIKGNLRQAINGACGAAADGPVMFTVSQRLQLGQRDVPIPFLMFDFAEHSEELYPRYVAAYKSQVTRADFSDGRNLQSLYDRVLDITVPINSRLPGIEDSIKGLVAMIGL